MKFNEFFEVVFCITLEFSDAQSEHPERLRETIMQFHQQGIKVIYIAGIDGRKLDISEPPSIDGDSVVRKADMGCNLSHLKVARLAKHRGLKNYFVFEDDVQLAYDFQQKFEAAIAELPESYRMLYAGGDNQAPVNDPEFKAKYLVQSNRILTTHAYGVDASAYDAVISALERHEKVDLNMAQVHEQGGCYIMHPVIAGQRPGWSYILGKQVQNEHQFFKV